jgi:hypothetical protein
LISSYGRPDFIKIDVEAYEAEVLAGLSEPVGALSFEYQGAYVEVTHQCLDHLGDEFTYALTRAEEPVFVTPWLDTTGVRAFLADVGPSDYGDVFARRLATTG